MPFLSRFSKSSKDATSKNHRRHSTPPPTTQTSSSYLPLTLPSSSLLRDESIAIPLGATSEDPLDATLSGSRSVDTMPWVEVAHDATGEGSPRILQRRPLEGDDALRKKLEDPLRARKEMTKIEKGRIDLEQMVTLVEECGEVIRSRGLTTLGLFRPFRLPESLPLIRQLCLLFLDYVSEFDPAHVSTTRGTRASKTVKLHRFKEELRYAEIHDVVAVLKWGFRHFAPSSPPFSTTSLARPAPFRFYYESYLVSTLTASCPHSSFSQFLLPLLAPTSQALLIATLNLIQAVSAYSEFNAMTCRKLCRVIGYYLFRFDSGEVTPSTDDDDGDGDDEDSGWERLYERWSASGEVLEGLVKGYLWEQDGLPPRLRELVDDYPKFVERSRTGTGDGGNHAGRKVRVLKVDMESRGQGWKRVGEEEGKANDQETGYLVSGRREAKFSRRRPAEILLDAFGAEVVGGEDVATWKIIRETGGAREVLDEEVVRILDLLDLSTVTDTTTMPNTPSTDGPPASPRRRVTSGPLASLSEESHSNGFGNFPNKSVTQLSPTRDQTRIVTPSWNDFARTGFSNPPTTVDISDEFGRFGSQPTTNSVPPKRSPKREPSRIVKIDVAVNVEEEFADLWLDSLFESTTTASPLSRWPSFVLAPLQASLSASLATLEMSGADRIYLLVSDKLLPLAETVTVPRPPPLLKRNSSKNSGKAESSSLNPRKWTKRASSIFGVSGGGNNKPNATDTSNAPGPAPAKTKKTSRRSMFFSDQLPPPVPIPSRNSIDPPSSPQPYSTSPHSFDGGNIVTRTISRTIQRRKSKSSIGGTSPSQSEDRELRLSSSPSKYEAELFPEPVPAIPAKYSVEVEEAKRRGSQTSPLGAPVALLSEETPAAVSSLTHYQKLPTDAGVNTVAGPHLPETPLRDILLRGPPILGAAIEPAAPPAEDLIPLADSPTISRAAAIRTPSSEAASLLLDTPSPPVVDTAESANEVELVATPEPTTTPIPSMTSPTFTLSPPGGAPAALPTSTEEEIVSRRTGDEIGRPSSEHTVSGAIESPPASRAASNLGLGLSNVDQPIFIEPREESVEPTTSSSPSPAANLVAPSTPSLDPASANPDSPTIPASPTPSGTSQGSASSSSKRFLARTRSFLARKKSSNALDNKDKDKDSSSKRDKGPELRQTPQRLRNTDAAAATGSAAQAKGKKGISSPTPVSSVKKRVAELEAASLAGINGSPLPGSPTTATRVQGRSSPTPTSPSPMPQDPGSAASSIVPLPEPEEGHAETSDVCHPSLEDEAGEEVHPLAQDVVEEIHEEERSTELGPTEVQDQLAPQAIATSNPNESSAALDGKVPTLADSNYIEETPVSVESESTEGEAKSSFVDGAPSSAAIDDEGPTNPLPDGTSADGSIATVVEPAEEQEETVDEVPKAAPAQEEQHLNVKVPTHPEDLPSPLPSPSPAPVDQAEADLEPLVDDSLTQAFPPPVAVNDAHVNGLEAELAHERQSTDSTIDPESVNEGDETTTGDAAAEPPHTPFRNNVGSKGDEPSSPSLATPIAPATTLFRASPTTSHQSSPPPSSATNDDPFTSASTPVKAIEQQALDTTNHRAPSSPSSSPRLVHSQSRPSLASTRNSTDTFETAAVPPSTTVSLHDQTEDTQDHQNHHDQPEHD